MAKIIKLTAAVSALLTVIFAALYIVTVADLLLTFAIIFGTTAYHFIMRLVVGLVINLIMRNKADYNAKWFRVSERELKIYHKLGVKKWKGNMPTYDPSLFDPRVHTWEEIAGAMCQAEIVHEVIVVMSFLPIFATIPFGALAVFIITSVISALYDSIFVIMQRFNRTRVIKHIHKKKQNS